MFCLILFIKSTWISKCETKNLPSIKRNCRKRLTTSRTGSFFKQDTKQKAARRSPKYLRSLEKMIKRRKVTSWKMAPFPSRQKCRASGRHKKFLQINTKVSNCQQQINRHSTSKTGNKMHIKKCSKTPKLREMQAYKTCSPHIARSQQFETVEH